MAPSPSDCNEAVKNIFVYGNNPFNSNRNEILTEMKLPNADSPAFQLEMTGTHAVWTDGGHLYAKSSRINETYKAGFEGRIAQISANTKHCLVLTENGDLFRYHFNSKQTDCLELTEESADSECEKITHIACGNDISVAITNRNAVFNIPQPQPIFSFPRHVRIAQVVVGFAHCLVLTSNGEVYSWGSGARGQLGNGIITPRQKLPQLVEALAGVKIVHIAAGAWHSAAVSSFGDLYTWGCNDRGQLGIMDTVKRYGSQHGRIDSTLTPYFRPCWDSVPYDFNEAAFPLPQLIELNDEVFLQKVFCGIYHTLAIDLKNEMYFSGVNLLPMYDYVQAADMYPEDLVGFKKLKIDPVPGRKLTVKSAAYSIIFMEPTAEDEAEPSKIVVKRRRAKVQSHTFSSFQLVVILLLALLTAYALHNSFEWPYP
ncbi:probable E3 ubiquitin-protein ligase HERC3 [Sabethes cyaneus]|uniref:probable E3 ubiquitin-protein ligase HERC3 n=1 Tax=Sabethes cyaneus TaxID=53552 RepID=UPI00237EC8D0|nr:probable E3 ubiquitin-protein ligase HERC3 [Sabethes cyaneus]